MVEDGAFSHKIDYFSFVKEILNLGGHPDCITGSKVTEILLNGWILPVGGVHWERSCFIWGPKSVKILGLQDQLAM